MIIIRLIMIIKNINEEKKKRKEKKVFFFVCVVFFSPVFHMDQSGYRSSPLGTTVASTDLAIIYPT